MNSRWRKRHVPLFLTVPLTFIFFLECKWAHGLLGNSPPFILYKTPEARTTFWSKLPVSFGEKAQYCGGEGLLAFFHAQLR